MGQDNAEAYGKRNAVKCEQLVKIKPTKIIGQKDIAAWQYKFRRFSHAGVNSCRRNNFSCLCPFIWTLVTLQSKLSLVRVYMEVATITL